uniref:Uncharacterized protein n=1 Tax=Trichogramma kaykai TaxID=54128 RepID=A0ABD2W3Z0_9HYME
MGCPESTARASSSSNSSNSNSCSSDQSAKREQKRRSAESREKTQSNVCVDVWLRGTVLLPESPVSLHTFECGSYEQCIWDVFLSRRSKIDERIIVCLALRYAVYARNASCASPPIPASELRFVYPLCEANAHEEKKDQK